MTRYLFKIVIILICACALSLFGFATESSSHWPQEIGSSKHADTQPTPRVDESSTIPSEGPKPNAPAAGPTYVIGPSDVITIRVWHEPDLSAEQLPVRPDGKISLALLNDVQAAGLTPMQLGQDIRERLKKYVSDPQVTVVVDVINSQRIYVMGEVARPGAYPLLPQMTVLQALSGSGGLQQYANAKKIYVLRGSKKWPFDYKQALRGEQLDRQLILQPGDTVVVP